MKLKIITTIAILLIVTSQLKAQSTIDYVAANKVSSTAVIATSSNTDATIRYPKTKRLIIVVIKVLNRHKATFYHNKVKITNKEALKLVRKEFPNLLVKEDRRKEEIHFTNNTL
jgi:hypothetical protein